VVSKEKIKARLLKSAARIWDVDDSDIETTFDPVVTMLIEGCVNEFQKINDDIDSAQARLLSRLAQLLTPDAITSSNPAHAIVHASTWERSFTDLPIKAQFYAGKKAPAPNNPTQEILHEVYFSPVAETRIFNGTVAILASNNFLYELNNITSKKLLDESIENRNIKSSRLWIGLNLSADVDSIENLSFYIDWRNNPEKQHYFAQLPYAKWFVGEHRLKVNSGMPNITKRTEENILLDEFDISFKIESQIQQFYKSSFVHVCNLNDIKLDLNALRVMPDEILESFSERTLEKIPNDLLWIRVEFPNTLPSVALNDIFCAINCFPALNRKLNEFTYRMGEGLNLIAMPSNEEFLAVHRVVSDDGYEYKSNPLTNSKNEVTGTYILRQGGVERFDVRNAAVLEQRSILKGDKRDSTAYLIVNPRQKGENLFLTFWSTNGEFANGFRASTKLDFYSGADISSDNLIFLTATTGGRPKLNDLERLSAYKNTLTSRDRIVTMQDIKTFCIKELGNRVSEIEVAKSFITGSDPKGGFVRVIDVIIFPSKKANYSDEEWQGICAKLEVELENNSSGIIPIKVKLKKNGESVKIKND